MIPGIIPFLISSSGKQLAVVANTLNTDSSSFTYPTGIQAGDFAIAIDTAMDTTSTPSSVTPSGFTSKFNSAKDTGFGQYNRIIISTRKFTGTVTGNVTGMAHSSSTYKTMLVLRPNWDVSIGSVADSGHKADAGNISNISISSAAFSEPYITLGVKHTQGSGNIACTLATDYGISTSSRAGSLYKWFLNSGEKQNIEFDIGDDGTWNFLAAIGLQLT